MNGMLNVTSNVCLTHKYLATQHAAPWELNIVVTFRKEEVVFSLAGARCRSDAAMLRHCLQGMRQVRKAALNCTPILCCTRSALPMFEIKP